MENKPFDTNDVEENIEPVYKDRSLVYMGLILGLIILIMGYFALFVDDPSKIFSKKESIQLKTEEEKSILNQSESMSEDEVRKTLTQFIESFYYDQRRGYFDPPSYFANITETFYNYHNLTHKRLKELYWKRQEDLENFKRNWIVSTLKFNRSDSRIISTYWAKESYLRRSLSQNYSALIKYEMVINEAGKIVSLKEVDLKNVEIQEVQPDSLASRQQGSAISSQPAPNSSDQVYDISLVDAAPEFIGGQREFSKYIATHIKYPAAARQNSVQGKVYLSFIVEKDGHLTDVRVKQGIGSGCDEEAIRLLRSSPKWRPGLIKEVPVRTFFVLPVTFQL